MRTKEINRKYKLLLLGLSILSATLFLFDDTHHAAWASHRVAQIAYQLEQRANHVWQEAQGRIQERYYEGHEGEDAMMLYFALNNFSNSASFYRQLADSFRDENLRGGARSLIIQAETIDELLDHTHTFGHLRRDWREVKRELGGLAWLFGLERSQGHQPDQDLWQRSPRNR